MKIRILVEFHGGFMGFEVYGNNWHLIWYEHNEIYPIRESTPQENGDKNRDFMEYYWDSDRIIMRY